MSFEEFIQTRGFGFTVMLVMYIGCLFMMYHTGKHIGFKQGASQVIHDKKQITQYVYPDGSIVYISEDEKYVVVVNINEGYIYRMPFKGNLDDEYYRLEGDRIVKVPRSEEKNENKEHVQ